MTAQKKIRFDAIQWIADCLGIDNHETVTEVVIRPREVIVRRFSGGQPVFCEHGDDEGHLAVVGERIRVEDVS